MAQNRNDREHNSVKVGGMFIDKHRQGVEAVRPMGVTETDVERAKDLHILAMARRKVPYRLIGRYFNISISTVHKRLKAIPSEARAHYGENPLARLG